MSSSNKDLFLSFCDIIFLAILVNLEHFFIFSFFLQIFWVPTMRVWGVKIPKKHFFPFLAKLFRTSSRVRHGEGVKNSQHFVVQIKTFWNTFWCTNFGKTLFVPYSRHFRQFGTLLFFSFAANFLNPPSPHNWGRVDTSTHLGHEFIKPRCLNASRVLLSMLYKWSG